MTLSRRFKTITSIALLSTFFVGCSATKPQVVNNKGIGDNSLYASLNKEYKIDKFSNKNNIRRGFIVNSYKPFGFDNKFYKSGDGGCLWRHKGTINSKYETIELESSPLSVAINIIFLPLSLPAGFSCTSYHAFNYKSFDDDMKDLLPQSDANKLLSNYDTLIETEHATENKINEQINKLNDNSLQKLKSIKERYIAIDTNKIIKKVKIVDKTGLYKNEKLPLEINIYKNNFPRLKFLQAFNYREYVDNAFPCTTAERCISNMNSASNSIDDKYQNDMKLISQQHNIDFKEDLKTYTKLSTFYNVNNNLEKSDTNLTKNGIEKKIFYTVAIKSSELPINKKLQATVTVTNINYYHVFPKYENKDKKIEIIFNPETQTYNLLNKTNKFIQIKSISLYYNGSIYNLTLNKDNNVIATELSPQAIKRFKLYDDIKESTYKSITKRQAQKKNFKFGFAIKYTIGEQTKNITLYSQHRYNVYSLIKSI